MKNLIFNYMIAVAVLSLLACGPQSQQTGSSNTESFSLDDQGQAAVVDEHSAKNVLQIAIGSKDHSTLVAAVQAAELENVLVNAGPLTVFAPTNAAFEALPAGTVEELLKPENKDKLSRIIKYHASPGKYMTDMLRDGQSLFQATGHYIKVEKEGENLKVDGAAILGTVEASNGVVHVIDKVLLPPDA